MRRTFRAAWHNKIVEEIRRRRPRYVRAIGPKPPHPWQVRVTFDPQSEKWQARVEPGFVNGLDPVVPGVRKPEPQTPRPQVEPIIPLATGKKVDMFENVATLCDDPLIPLHDFRPGFSGISAAAKLYFESRGASQPAEDKFDINTTTGTVTMLGEGIEDAPPPRPLRALDLYLTIARASMSGGVQVVDASGTTGQVAQYVTTYESLALDLYGRRARLMQAPAMPAASRPPTATEIVNNTGPTDDGEDRQAVATIFLIGPPGAEDTPHPDGTWEPHVQHHLFWNVMHATARGEPGKTPQPIRLATGLAWADFIGNQLLAPANDLFAAIMAAFNSSQPAGRFFSV